MWKEDEHATPEAGHGSWVNCDENSRGEKQFFYLLMRIVKININSELLSIIAMIHTPGVPFNRLCCANNGAADRLHSQHNVGALNSSKITPRLHSRCVRICALNDEDADSIDQPCEPSTSQTAAIQWAPLGPPPSAKPPPRLVKTQRGIPMVLAPIPDDRCPECNGMGKLTCGACKGKGRLNYRKAAMLPKGAWPEWCPHCRASGKWVCSACMGTGERREPMGFRIQ